MTNIPLALRLIACGLPVPTFTPGKDGGCASWITSGEGDDSRHWEVDLSIGDTCRPFGTDPAAGLLFRCVTTDDGLRLLPDTSDPLLIGFVLSECRKRWPYIGTWYAPSHPGWMAGLGGRRWYAETEIEALTAAWESALKTAE